MNILYVTHELPFPTVAGHHIRSMEIINALPRCAKVHVLGYSETGLVPQRLGRVSFDAIPGRVRIRRRPLALARSLTVSLVSGRPYSMVKYPKAAMRSAILRHCALVTPDLMLTSVFTRHLIPDGPWTVLLDTHNVEHELWQSFVPLLSSTKAAFVRREARLLQQSEQAAWQSSDGIIAICEEDAVAIRAACPAVPVRHVPVHVPPVRTEDAAKDRAADGPHFDVGMLAVWSWAPNARAAVTFAQDILPGLAQAGLRVLVAGPGLDPAVRTQLVGLGAHCPGFLPDLAVFYRNVRIVAAPYTLGGGVRMKVAEALSWGVPVIGNHLAFRGIGPGVPADWIVKDAEELTAALIRHAANPPHVPPVIANNHTLQCQQFALYDLITAAQKGIPAQAIPTG